MEISIAPPCISGCRSDRGRPCVDVPVLQGQRQISTAEFGFKFLSSSLSHVLCARLRHVSSAGKQARHELKTSGTRARARQIATETCERAQFLINSTLKAEKEVQQQRASNELLAKELARLTALFQERRGTVLEAKEEALSAVAQLCALQLREKRLREEEEHESSSATREAALLQMAVADHRKVQVLSQALGMPPLITSSAPVAGSSIDADALPSVSTPCLALLSLAALSPCAICLRSRTSLSLLRPGFNHALCPERSLDEKHGLQCNAFKNASEINVLQDLRATLKASTGSKCPRTSLENIAGT